MNLWIGTSGFQYAEWKGNFYPEDLPTAKMLPFYSERFSTTEINYTFHRIPAPKTIENWKTLTPDKFRFALKAPQKITHWSKLKDCADTLEYFCKVVTGLGERLGPVLFQLPPTFKKDADVLSSFLREFPSMRAAFEFRHDSWFDDEIFDLLKSRNISLCIADTDDLATPKKITADYGYLRLRREDYQKSDRARRPGRPRPGGRRKSPWFPCAVRAGRQFLRRLDFHHARVPHEGRDLNETSVSH